MVSIMMKKTVTRVCLVAALGVSVSACFGDNQNQTPEVETTVHAEQPINLLTTKVPFANRFAQDVVWAVNLGGQAYSASYGLEFEQGAAVSSLPIGEVDSILGSQDSGLYQTYFEGEFEISRVLPNGTYDVTFLFAEPEETAVGDRVFDVYVNGKVELEGIDIRGMRDGKVKSALDKTVQKIAVNNGRLDIKLAALKGKPVISGLIIRRYQNDSQQWQMVWNDEFDYIGQPDPSKWSYNEWPARKVNDEDQVYTSREKNVRVENGKLIIEAHKEQYDNGEYTSGRIHTLGTADLLYGRIDVRAKLPAGRGTWSAIWMLPSDPYKYSITCKPNEDWQGSQTCDAWPNSGEIDLMEHVGFDMHNVHGTVHNKAYYWINWEQRKGAINARNVDEEFHVYSVEWSPEHITVLMDGTPYFTYINEHTGWRAWPFDHPYHLILNLAIGGMWGRAGGPIDDSIFPVQMEIDYVRFFTQS